MDECISMYWLAVPVAWVILMAIMFLAKVLFGRTYLTIVPTIPAPRRAWSDERRQEFIARGLGVN